ncbi:MAG TPA: TonB-dependent receptor plug domain-containing protein, partial [Bacteroidales bacterium]|nr:TonB-dependent receptor plug domain-containing protein [Bacteroidales bacterium]
KIEEQLSGRDLPMILNSTPGVYATEQGGGDGDARITIRGFSQRNVAVMLDGIPVNDMENGWVYWSNWFGLDQVTRSIQVQRGLSASRLALPSVGGTINIITKGIEQKRETSVQEFVDMYGKSTTSVGFTSGMLKHGWGITAASSYKKGSSWVENTDVEAFFLYLKVDKRWKNHITSLTGYGAPQTHDQHSYKSAIATYSTEYARKLGISEENFPSITNLGINYNQHWGYIQRDAEQWNADHSSRIINPNAPVTILNERVNTYFKPQFSLRDSWTVNDKLSVTNIAYMSIGRGGGQQAGDALNYGNLIAPGDTIGNMHSPKELGQVNWQSIYNGNTRPVGFSGEPTNPLYGDTIFESTNYLVENRNEHNWYGLLSNVSYNLNNQWSFSGGLDLRSYEGTHYSLITDLLGGDYIVDKSVKGVDGVKEPWKVYKTLGDTVNFNETGWVRWGGVFGLVEYKNGVISTFLNLSTYYSGFMRKDYFNHTTSPWKWIPGFTVKTGLNYNFTEHSSVFTNLGYLSRVKMLNYIYSGYTTNFVNDLSNEKIMAIELGYAYKSPVFSANLNTYATRWENKPTGQVSGNIDDPQTGQEVEYFGNITNMNANHVGIELDFIYKLSPKLKLQGLLSLGDWRWDKKVDNLVLYDQNNVSRVIDTISFDARGIHVGNAAQTQIGGSVRY